MATVWREAESTPAASLKHKAYGDWWELLSASGITLLVTREYEHLVMAIGLADAEPFVTFMPMPHPSGIAVDRDRGRVFVASTRNPNQLYEFRPVSGSLPRLDVAVEAPDGRPLLPAHSSFYPGCLYLHDLAFVGRELYGNAVGQNAVVRLAEQAAADPVWWPRCVEQSGAPVLGQNHIQLNSIAAGETLKTSYFSASSDTIAERRPGDPKYPVDKRGVIFSGTTREPVVRGLTRPHSARLSNGALWVLNSGYGELCQCDSRGSGYTAVTKAPGWTRGLCFRDNLAFVGTSRVIPRFRSYAPGLDLDASVCGVHAVDLDTGQIRGGLVWPAGNQVFAVDWMDRRQTSGFPFRAGKRATRRERDLFYAYNMAHTSCLERA